MRIRELGRGGFGAVWLVWDRELSRPAALKLLHGTAPEDRARFLREARVAAKLSHPGIVPVFDAGELDGEPFIVMEYVDGVAADAAGLDARGAADVVRQTAEAIEHAHRSGVVHRDVKPQNILVARGHAWVTDFGLAKSLGVESSLSMTGDIMGTPGYMAPEQARGDLRAIGPHTDVYGLGALLYRLAGGRTPHEGPNAYEVLRKVIEEDPAPPSCDRELAAVCLRAMEKEPARRYASAADVAADLSRWLAGEAVAASPPSAVYRAWRWARRRRSMLIPAVVATVALTALAVTFGVREYRRAADLRAADALYAQAQAEVEERQYGPALKTLTRAAELAPGDPRIASLADECREAVTYLREHDRFRDRLERLRADLREAGDARFVPKTAPEWLRSWCEAGVEEASRIIGESAVPLAEAYYVRGCFRTLVADWARAIEDLEQAVRLRETPEVRPTAAYFELAMARLGLHQEAFYVEAYKGWDVKVAPSHPLLVAAFDDLDRSVARGASDAERLLRDLLVEDLHASGRQQERMRPLVVKMRAALDARTLDAGVLPRHRALLRVRLAGKLLAVGDRDGASAECVELLQWMPLDPVVLSWLNDLVWNTSQDPANHAKVLAPLEALAPDSVLTWAAAYAHHRRAGSPDDAVSLCDRAIARGMDRSFWLMLKGEAHDAAGRGADAVMAYLEAIEADPNNSRALRWAAKRIPPDRVESVRAAVLAAAENPEARALAERLRTEF